MLSAAKTRFAGDASVELITHNLDEPLPNLGSFDAVVSSFAIHHVTHDRKRYLYTEIGVALMNIPQPWVLSIDRTEWSSGQTRFNIFMLGIVHQGVAYPLVWTMLEKKGNFFQ